MDWRLSIQNWTGLGAIGIGLVTATPAAAQVPGLPLEPVDQSVTDRSPLSASLRETQIDLRQPVGFHQVYRVPGRDDLYMRVSGALHAVFPQSFYARGRGGVVPVIPPGTVFYIGPPTQLDQSRRSSAPRPFEVHDRVNLRVGDVDSQGFPIEDSIDGESQPPVAPPTPRIINAVDDEAVQALALPAPPPAPSASWTIQPESSRPSGPAIVNDAAYRARRMEELLTQAVNRQANRQPGGG